MSDELPPVPRDLAEIFDEIAAAGAPPADARVRTPFCPRCGEPPRALINMFTAVCGTDSCPSLMWDMTMTAQQLMLNTRQIKLLRDDE